MGVAGVETVTVLITGLVGSTQLESRVGPIVSEELREEHFGLLRQPIASCGGREVKNTGVNADLDLGARGQRVS
jgi:class 3 adenylate cyclase